MATSNLERVSKIVGVSLLLTSVLATGGTLTTVIRSGFFKLLKAALAAHPVVLPVVNVPVKHTYTGLPPVDGFIRAFHVLIYPAIDGTWPGLCLSAWEFSGMFSVTWMLAGLEGLRAATSTTIVGSLSQALTYSNIVPLYLGLHVLTSPTALATPTTNPAADFLIDPPSLAAWAPAYSLAYLLPTFLVILPSPKYTSWNTRQNIMAAWELYPIPFKIFQILLARYVFQKATATSSSSSKSSTATLKTTNLALLKNFYIFAAALSAITHVTTLTLTYSPTLFPSLFSSFALTSIHPASVFIPASPLSSARVSSLGEGLARLLVWNATISSLAPLAWGLLMVRNALVFAGRGGEWVAFAGKVGGVSAVAGPGAGVAWCLWERDRIVLGDEGVKRVKDK
ncbi:MAG: hypothetical protein Q9202_005802 [Teloschistes flavicans]